MDDYTKGALEALSWVWVELRKARTAQDLEGITLDVGQDVLMLTMACGEDF